MASPIKFRVYVVNRAYRSDNDNINNKQDIAREFEVHIFFIIVVVLIILSIMIIFQQKICSPPTAPLIDSDSLNIGQEAYHIGELGDFMFVSVVFVAST